MRTFSGRLFCVPERCVQYFAEYRFVVPTSVQNAIEYSCEEAAKNQTYLPTDKGGLGHSLHMYPFEELVGMQVVYEADYQTPNAKVTSPKLKIDTPIARVKNLCLGVLFCFITSIRMQNRR